MKMILAILLVASNAFANPVCSDLFSSPVRVKGEREFNESSLTKILDAVFKKQDSGVRTLEQWVGEIHKEASSTSLREHMALILVREMGLLEGSSARELDAAIRESYVHHTGVEPRDLKRLPPGLVKSASEIDKAFYLAVQTKIATGEKIPLRRKIADKIATLRESLTVTKAVSLLLATAAMVYEPNARGVIAGSLIGLAQAGLIEYTIHLGIGHASTKMLERLRKIGPLGDFMEEVRLEHQLHHQLVSMDFRMAVLSPEQLQKADEITTKLMRRLLIERAKRKNPALTDEQIVSAEGFDALLARKVKAVADANYGMDSSLPASIKMLVSGTHYYIANTAIFAATGDVGYFIASNAVMSFMTVQSIYSHYYMHYYPEFRSTEGRSRLMVAFLNTPLGQQARRRHIEHHMDRFVGAGNGNIMAFAPADVILRDLTELQIENLVEMQARGILPEI